MFHYFFAARQFKTKHRTLPRSALNFGTCMMTFQYVFNDGQTEAGAPFCPPASLIYTIKPLKHPVALLRPNPLSFVYYRFRYLPLALIRITHNYTALIDMNHNFTVIVRVVDRMRYEVTQHLADPQRVGIRSRGSIALDAEFDAAFRRFRFKLLQYLFSEFVEFNRFKAHLNLTRLNL